MGPNRLFGVAGAVAITLILQAYGYGWYVWIPAAIIAYAIASIFLGIFLLPFRFRAANQARAQQPSVFPLTPEQHAENLKSILGDQDKAPPSEV